MKNVIVLEGMNFSETGLGQIVNAAINSMLNATPGYINENGEAKTGNAIWNARCKFSDYIAIPSGAQNIVGTSVHIIDTGADLPIISFYDSSKNFVAGKHDLAYVSDSYSTSGPEYQKGSVNAIIPTNAAYIRTLWTTGTPSSAPTQDPNEATTMQNGPELVFSKLDQ